MLVEQFRDTLTRLVTTRVENMRHSYDPSICRKTMTYRLVLALTFFKLLNMELWRGMVAWSDVMSTPISGEGGNHVISFWQKRKLISETLLENGSRSACR